ncbi:hypothetical protein WKI45_08790 [Delftia tsuruhatensis]
MKLLAYIRCCQAHRLLRVHLRHCRFDRLLGALNTPHPAYLPGNGGIEGGALGFAGAPLAPEHKTQGCTADNQGQQPEQGWPDRLRNGRTHQLTVADLPRLRELLPASVCFLDH